jgi:hypothetical protein
MREWRPVRRARVAARAAADGAVATMLRNSLVAYLAVALLGKAWALLNADLLQLLRR